MKPVDLVCISDTHGDHEAVDLPAGDVLIHAGDITAHGTELDLLRFLDWFSARDFAHRLFTAGNHDSFLETSPVRTAALAREAGVTWLNDSGIHAAGISFWGTPITPRFQDWSFMRDPGADIERHWAMIPETTDVLISHGPPFGILDEVARGGGKFEKTGCPSLQSRVDIVQPALHIFGHIHEGHGRLSLGGIDYLNVSTMNRHYRISNPPVVVRFPLEGGDDERGAVTDGDKARDARDDEGPLREDQADVSSAAGPSARHQHETA